MPLHFRGTKEQMRAVDAYVKLVRSANAVSRRLEDHLREWDLSENQFGVMEAVWHMGPLSPTALAEKLFTSSPNVTKVVSSLEKRGYIERFKGSADKRRKTVMVSKDGARVVAAVWKSHLEAIVRDLAILTPPEQEELARLCRILGLRVR